MKRPSLGALWALLLFFVFGAASAVPPPVARAAESPAFAMISAATTLLRAPEDDGPGSRYFDLLPSYFVELLPDDGVSAEGYRAVRYDGISGYIPTAAITPVDYTPAHPYPDAPVLHFSIDSATVNVRSRPLSSPEYILAAVPSAAASVRYWGRASGEAVSGTDEYYYIGYTGEAGAIRGYVSAAHTVVDTAIPLENDTSPVVPAPPEEAPPETDTPLPPSTAPLDWKQIALIIGITLGVLVVIILIFRPRRKRSYIPITDAPRGGD
ncbi:MAG: hypothetical protein LBM78_02455 [Clostridiales bacterium]|jgi:hypothetical protein|nr:hypothetical protein [Clostridiales bacterium]